MWSDGARHYIPSNKLRSHQQPRTWCHLQVGFLAYSFPVPLRATTRRIVKRQDPWSFLLYSETETDGYWRQGVSGWALTPAREVFRLEVAQVRCDHVEPNSVPSLQDPKNNGWPWPLHAGELEVGTVKTRESRYETEVVPWSVLGRW